MADITEKKGINVTSGFKLISPAPIDARYVVADETELQSIISSGAVYNGLIVWVDSLNKAKQYNGSEFVDIAGGITEERVVELIEEKLPSEGTTVPCTGFVNSVYFNTKLSVTEVSKKLSALGYNETPLLPMPINILLASTDYSKVIIATKVPYSSSEIDYEIMEITNFGQETQTSKTLFATMITDPDNAGWKVENNYTIAINNNVLEEYYIEGVDGALLLGVENYKIKELFSITPFSTEISVDEILSPTSINPVQNKVIYQAIQEIIATQNLIDVVLTYEELQDKYGADGEITTGFNNGDKVKVLQDETHDNKPTYYVWNGTEWAFYKEDAKSDVTADSVVTEGSTNLITSGAVADYVKKEIDNAIVSALTGEY